MDRRSFIGSLIGMTVATALPFMAERPKERYSFIPAMNNSLLHCAMFGGADDYELVLHTDVEPIKGTKLVQINRGWVRNCPAEMQLCFDAVNVQQTMKALGMTVLFKGEHLVTRPFAGGPVCTMSGDILHCKYNFVEDGKDGYSLGTERERKWQTIPLRRLVE